MRKDIGAKWVDDAKLLPMLDGLDELNSALQEQRVGRRYRFIHRLLQEHFAAMPLEK
ncbi:hypothetical protein [Tolypothrix sp. PCC 7601]|uniref:hypothetical protein n=1 Tax=Tolypothrix sp. PCC 7601 TaxID=1188 RepID=UPI001AEF7CFE|nr:hypothetical protein [Tolypothrix sp. PCC 7601]UYD38335.1 hypothetical protein HG267_38190 [Tolypothrix sp. PCC 7601]